MFNQCNRHQIALIEHSCFGVLNLIALFYFHCIQVYKMEARVFFNELEKALSHFCGKVIALQISVLMLLQILTNCQVQS